MRVRMTRRHRCRYQPVRPRLKLDIRSQRERLRGDPKPIASNCTLGLSENAETSRHSRRHAMGSRHLQHISGDHLGHSPEPRGIDSRRRIDHPPRPAGLWNPVEPVWFLWRPRPGGSRQVQNSPTNIVLPDQDAFGLLVRLALLPLPVRLSALDRRSPTRPFSFSDRVSVPERL